MNTKIIKDAYKQFKYRVSVSYFLNTDNDLSTVFDGDVLTVAIEFQKNLILEVERWGGTNSNVVHNAKVATNMNLLKPKIKSITNPCTRCDGTGVMPYRHVKNGICFKCEGTGKNTN